MGGLHYSCGFLRVIYGYLPSNHMFSRNNMQTFELKETTRVAVIRGEVESAVGNGQTVVLRGRGDATTKVVSLAEMLKRQFPDLQQATGLICEDAGLEITLSGHEAGQAEAV